MISTAKRAGLLQRKYVGWLFYDTEQLRCARGVGAYLAEVVGCEKSTKTAGTNRLASIRDSARNLLRWIVALPHHPTCNPFVGSGPHSRHSSQLRPELPH